MADLDSDSSTITALMGLVAGAIGVWALDRVDWFLFEREPEEARERTRKARPGGEAPAGVIVTRAAEAAGTTLSSEAHQRAELATHYSIGIAPAVGYALLRDRLPGPSLVRGALFGASLWAIQDEGLNAISGLGGKPNEYPWQAHARGLIAHAVFGMTTEAALLLFEKAGDSITLADDRDQESSGSRIDDEQAALETV